MEDQKKQKFIQFFTKLKDNNYFFVTVVLIVILLTLRLFIILTPVFVSQESMKITIPKGSNLSQIASQLVDQKVIHNPKSFILAAHLMFKDRSLKAGFFNLQSVRNYRSLIKTLSTSQIHAVKVTVPEGYQTKQIARLIADQLDFDSESFMRYLNDKQFLVEIGIESPSLEGYLFPDTYYFNDSDNPQDIIRKMVGHFHEMINDSILMQIHANQKTLHEMLTLASIVEGECMIDDERPLVASVYLNRLKNRMRLESDPTIQYIIEDGPRRLLSKDLEIDSPYNTYRNRGLPPGPINNPGIKSILAAIHPADTNYLYMVAVGNGTHSFHSNYDSFLKAKKQFQRVRRQVARDANKGK